MFAWWFRLSARLVGGKLKQNWDYSPSHQSPACSQHVSQSAQASGPRIHQRGQVRHPEKWVQPYTCEDGLDPGVSDSWSMRDIHSKGKTQIESSTPIEYLPLFLLKSWQSVPHDWTSRYSSIEHMCMSEPLTHSQVHSHCGYMKGNVIRLKMINAPICQSRHLEPICSTGARTSYATNFRDLAALHPLSWGSR